jgi:putative ABC transport system permease protein
MGRQRERELAEELESHIRMQTDDNLRLGMPPDEARRAAMLKFGSVESAKESMRDQRGLPNAEAFLKDIRYAGRGIRKNPGFAAAVILTLALGIGANTAIFSAVNAVILRPLPFHEPERLVKIDQSNQRLVYGFREGGSWRQYEEWRQLSTVFEDLAAYNMNSHELLGGGEPVRILSLEVSENFFSLIATPPLLGRTLGKDDFSSGRNVVVISHRLWQSAFGGDPDIIGEDIQLSEKRYSIVGVMPPRFRYPPAILQVPGMSFEAWQPIPDSNKAEAFVIGRLARGRTIEEAEAEMNVILQRQYAAHYGSKAASEWTARLTRIPDRVTGNLRPAMWMLLVAVGLVLLIACTNVASLLLARSSARSREIAVRTALGASRGRLLRQALVENLLLSGLGAAAGLAWAYGATKLLIPLFPHGIPRVEEIGFDGAVFAFTGGVAILASLLFGLPPAVAAKASVFESLKQSGSAAAAGPSSSRLLRGLVVGEIALSLVLLVGAGLSLRSLYALVNQDTGFQAQHVLTMRLQLSPHRYPSWSQARAFHQAVLEKLGAIPGVESAALAQVLPLSGRSVKSPVVLGDPAPESENLMAEYNVVTPAYFRSMGVPLLKGRFLDQSDTPAGPQVAVVSRSAAERFWPGQQPQGKLIRNANGASRVVVGVVEDEKHWDVWSDPDPKIYIPYSQAATSGAQTSLQILTFAVLRTAGDPRQAMGAARQAVWDVDKDQPIVELKPMQQLVDDSMAEQRFQSVLLGGMAALALVLASIGTYGVLAFVVSRQRHEIGVRVALGARSRDIVGTVLLHGLKPAVSGIVLGLIASLGLSRLIEHQLFAVQPFDPLTYGVVALVLFAVAALACYPAAAQAAKVDPMITLRQE